MNFSFSQNLSQLRLFTQLASSRNLAAVSMAEGLTSDQVKRAVKLLERNLQRTLLRFHGGRVSLTDSGHDLFEISWPLIQSIEHNAKKILDVEQWQKCRLVIGLEGCHRWMIPIIHKFSERHPDTLLKISTNHTAMSFTACCPDICIDVCKDSGLKNAPSIDSFKFKLLHVIRPELIQPGKIKVSNINLHYKSEQNESDSLFRNEHHVLPALIETVSLDMAYELALSGAGSVILPEFMVREEVVTGRLVELGDVDECVYVRVYASLRKRNMQHIQEFVDFMRVAIPFFLNETRYFS